MVADLHRPTRDISNIPNARTLTNGEAGSADAAPGVHGGGDAVLGSDHLVGVGQDRRSRLHDNGLRCPPRFAPKCQSLILVGEVDDFEVLGGLEVPGTQAAVVGVGTKLTFVERLVDDVSRGSLCENTLIG